MKHTYSTYFPTPAYLSMHSFALDISDQSIKYGIIHVTHKGLRLGAFGQQKIPEGSIVSGKIEDPEKLVSILRELARRERMHFVRVSLPEEQMYLFTLTVPVMKREDIRDAIVLQLEEHIPLQAAETVFDYEILSSKGDTMTVEVSATAISTIESYMSVFERVGLVPLSFELEAQAIARAVIPAHDDNPLMIVDFGDSRTGVSIAYNQKVVLTTTIDFGGHTLTNMIAKKLNITFDEAEKIKRTYGKDEQVPHAEIFPIIVEGLKVLKDELEKNYTYWQSHDDGSVKHGAISRIVLCGGDANLSGLADYISNCMKVRTERADAWINISLMDRSVPLMSFEESLGFVTVLGLALGDYLQDDQTLMNVLPKSEKKRLHREYVMRLGTSIASLFSLLGCIAILCVFPVYFLSVSKASIADLKLEAFNKANPAIANTNTDTAITEINTKLFALSKATQSDVTNTVFGTIAGVDVPGIRLSKILYNDGDQNGRILQLYGYATDRDTLRNFKTTLEQIKTFASVAIPISDFLGKANIKFTSTITIK